MRLHFETEHPFNKIDALHGWVIDKKLIGPETIPEECRRWSRSGATLWVDFVPEGAIPAMREDEFERTVFGAVLGDSIPWHLQQSTVAVFPRSASGLREGLEVYFPLQKFRPGQDLAPATLAELAQDVYAFLKEAADRYPGYNVGATIRRLRRVYNENPHIVRPVVAALWHMIEEAALTSPVLVERKDARRHLRRHSRKGDVRIADISGNLFARIDPNEGRTFIYNFEVEGYRVPLFAVRVWPRGRNIDRDALVRALMTYASLGARERHEDWPQDVLDDIRHYVVQALHVEGNCC